MRKYSKCSSLSLSTFKQMAQEEGHTEARSGRSCLKWKLSQRQKVYAHTHHTHTRFQPNDMISRYRFSETVKWRLVLKKTKHK